MVYLMTSRHPSAAISKFNTDVDNETITFSEEFIKIFTNTEVGYKKIWKPSQTGILVTASQNLNNTYEYNTVTAVLFTEVLKLIISSCLYLKSHSIINYGMDILKYKGVLLLYFVPAFLYCLYNNLSFTNLSSFDPTTYYLLLQLRVVITGILFQIIFSKTLTKMQWISLIILTCGCKSNRLISVRIKVPMYQINLLQSVWELIIIIYLFVQILCSCHAGVYNEYLLKKQGANVDISIQNVFMYLDSIVCNLFLLSLFGNVTGAFEFSSMRQIFNFKVLIVILNNACIGIVTSFFLKTMNSILKTFASALELILTAVSSWILFGIPIYMNTFLSICTVLFAVYLYSKNPVSNIPKPSQEDNVAKEPLLTEDV